MPDPTQNLRLKVSGDTSQAKGQLVSLKGPLTELNSAVSLVKQGYQAVSQVMSETVGKFMETAIAAGDLAVKLGTSTEEASALREMCDDLGVSAGSLEAAFKKMSKEGIDTSIEGLISVRARLDACATSSDRLELAQKLLGKSGADLLPIFDQLTNEQLRDYVKGMGEGQVITDAEYESAKQLRAELDLLKDAWDNLTLLIGGRAAEAINGIAGLLELLNGAVANGTASQLEMNVAVAEYAAGHPKHLYALLQESDATNKVAEANRSSSHWQHEVSAATVAAYPGIEDLTDKTDDANAAFIREAGSLAEVKRRLDALRSKDIIITTVHRDVSYEQWLAEHEGSATQGHGQVGTGQDRSRYDPNAGNIIHRETGDFKVNDDGTWTRLASGGPLSGFDEVGDVPGMPGGGPGTEGIINGRVIPHGPWEMLKRLLGIKPKQHSRPKEDGPGGGGVTGTSIMDVFWNYVMPDQLVDAGFWPPTSTYGDDGGGGRKRSKSKQTSSKSAAQVVKEVVQEQTAAVAEAIPAAVSKAAAEQNAANLAETRRLNADLIKEVRTMRKEMAKFPTYIRDAVERVL